MKLYFNSILKSFIFLLSSSLITPFLLSIIIIPLSYSDPFRFTSSSFISVLSVPIILFLPLIVILLLDYIEYRRMYKLKKNDDLKEEFRKLLVIRILAFLSSIAIIIGLLYLFCGFQF